MTDIVGQAARVIGAGRLILRDNGKRDNEKIAQALTDAGLLRDPARTVPTREEIARALSTHHYSIAYGGCACGADFEDETETLEAEQEAYNQHAADEVLELLAGQPTVAEVKAQALEGAAELLDQPRALWFEFGIGVTVQDDTNRDVELTTWLRERAQQHRDGK